jgi:acetolactate synthase I/II/III large subunit
MPATTASTAGDTLQVKRGDGSALSGAHLVAKAPKAEGVDTIFTLGGGTPFGGRVLGGKG